MAPIIKEDWEIELIHQAGKILDNTLKHVKGMVKPGVSTGQIAQEVERYLAKNGAYPTFKGYRGFPGSICTSINEEVVHGIPSFNRVLKEGDILSIDIGVTFKNYIADAAVTLPVGRISSRVQRLIDATRRILDQIIGIVRPYIRLSTISKTIEEFARSHGYSVVKKFVGHGVGQFLHEDPQIPNYVIEPVEEHDMILSPGLVIAPEPMFTEGTSDVVVLPDGWTVVTADRKLSSHFEHTIAITKNGARVLTIP